MTEKKEQFGNSLKFIADPGLPGIAKHLRILGIDCIAQNDFTNGYLCYLAQNTDRILLTKSSKLLLLIKQHEYRCKKEEVENKINYYYVESIGCKEQIMEIVTKFKLVFIEKDMFKRCVKCNGVVQPIEKSLVKGKLHDNVFNENEFFAQCQKCNQITYGTEKGNKKHELGYQMSLDFCQKYSYKPLEN